MQYAARVNAAGKIICGSDCPVVAVFRNPTAPNAALIASAGELRLAYAPKFFSALYTNFGDPGILAIIAHELGHGLDDVMGAAWINTKWSPEVRADSWAGCVLAKSNLTPADVHAALGALQNYPSPAHPAWNLRLPAIRIGYTHCGGAASNIR
jgi:hypothetical protein